MSFLKYLYDKILRSCAFSRPSNTAVPRDSSDEQDRSGFFIEPSECITCGCCEAEAPKIFGPLSSQTDMEGGNVDDYPASSCVIKQPETPEEVAATVKAAAYCMVGCIYYGGDDPEVFRQWSKHLRDQEAYSAEKTDRGT